MPPRPSLRWLSLAILTTGLLSVGLVGVYAQSTTAICDSSFNWMQNSKDQSPCLVSAYLQGACNGGQFTISALPPHAHYTGPYVDQQNGCQCSSITYCLVSACGACQNATTIDWSVWSANCSAVYPKAFPPGIPVGTAVPQWAFQDVTTSDLFNVTLAQSVGDNPESTATHVQSTGSSPLPSSTGASLTAVPSASGSTSGSKSNAGAIAGGVIGGVIVIVLIACAIAYFVVRQKRSRIPPSAQFAGNQMTPLPPSAYADTTPFASQMGHPRFYDPSDPSTFPGSPAPPTVRTGGSSYDVPSSPYYSSPSMRTGGPGQYTGMPEI